MNTFFEEQGKRWVAAAERRGATIDAPSLDAEVARELLELARAAAHAAGVAQGDPTGELLGRVLGSAAGTR